MLLEWSRPVAKNEAQALRSFVDRVALVETQRRDVGAQRPRALGRRTPVENLGFLQGVDVYSRGAHLP
jgi:hypothetical protein